MGGLNLEVFKVSSIELNPPFSEHIVLPRLCPPNVTFSRQPTDLLGKQFGMYVMFPIGIMFYFGTNLDERFAVPDFWPKPEQANRVPHERDEIHAELQRLRARRLYLRDRRLEAEAASRAKDDAGRAGGNDGEGRSS